MSPADGGEAVRAGAAGERRIGTDRTSPRSAAVERGEATDSDVATDTMREHHITVPRTARYHTLGVAGPGLEQLWFVCHGYGQLAARFLRRFHGLDDGRRLIVAPEALSRYYLDDHGGPHGPQSRVGATWMTREDRLAEIHDYVRYLDILHDHVLAGINRAAVRVLILGFSQGTATVSRWTTMGRARPDDLILWAGGLPPDLDMQRAAERLGGLRVRLVAGDRDRFASDAMLDAQLARMREHGISPDLVRFEGGHHMDPDTLRRLASGPA